ncbi:hypothetical protein GCM10020000_49390 [Streptomyces olivoverticillatus]
MWFWLSGIGGARFLRGLKSAVPDADITVIGNTGDDIHLFGLKVCPDLDTVMYTLGGGIHEEQGWGRAGETFAVKEELAAYGVGPEWFGLGDRDFATHIVRTQMLAAGYPLSAVTEALCARWQPGVRLLPMTDDRVETHVLVDLEGARKAVHFQEYWVRLRAEVPAHAIVPVGAEEAKPAPGVLEALAAADVILFPPSNPVVSVGSILSVPGIREAVAAADAPVVGLSPPSSAAPRCAAWPTRCWPPSASSPPPRPSPGTTAPICWTAGWWTPSTRRRWPRSRPRASAAARCR